MWRLPVVRWERIAGGLWGERRRKRSDLRVVGAGLPSPLLLLRISIECRSIDDNHERSLYPRPADWRVEM